MMIHLINTTMKCYRTVMSFLSSKPAVVTVLVPMENIGRLRPCLDRHVFKVIVLTFLYGCMFCLHSDIENAHETIFSVRRY